MSIEEIIVPLFFILLAAALYVIPGWIAAVRKHHQFAAIFALNLLLGWTFLGWAAAFIWSLSAIRLNPTAS